jgi:DNA-binding beta-propeller fold protein YncE
MRKYTIILFLFAVELAAQNLELISAQKLFDDAVSFSINQSNSIYVADRFRNEIYSADSSFNIMESYGGNGSDVLSFDSPSDIFATELNVFVTDRNNNRIQVFDKKLNFIFTFDPKISNADFDEVLYPAGCIVSSSGDFFMLDNENNRILKFDSKGKFLLQFGNYESGDFQLTSPIKILTDGIKYVFVIETKRIIVFDLFGNGLIQIPTELETVSASLSDNFLVLNSDSEIHIFKASSLKNPVTRVNLFNVFSTDDIRQAALIKNKLIVLTKESLMKFNLSN